ncbi:MAG: diguanylate cyclase [Actinomycetota bacterium]|jgi:diguanylate cyclase (GGDEF)-like protein|nr:diguanylate cyclase [Actinomycetota bacterium]MDQ1642440.1 diguanylate cyclase [Actinomycetota bacterium]
MGRLRTEEFLLPQARRGLVRGAIVLLCLLLAAHLATLVPAVHRFVDGTPFYELVQDTMYVLAGIVVAARAALVRQERLAWGLLSIGLLSYAAGNIVYIAYVSTLSPEPFPSVADALWLPLYPFGYACVVLLLRAHTKRWLASMWLDGLVAGLGVGSVAVGLVLRPVLSATDGSFLAAMMNLAYPIADLLLLALVVGVFATMGWRPSSTWWLLGLGMLAFVVADSVYLLQVAGDTYVGGAWLDSVWLVGIVPIAVAAWTRTTDRDTAPPSDGWAILALPASFTLVAVGLLVWGSLEPTSAALAMVLLAAGTIIAALFRTSLTFREVRALADARRQARTDDLTGLGNRRYFLEQLEGVTDEAGTRRPAAVLLIDLDGFKEVNDSYGHQAGDTLLRLVGARLVEAIGPEGILTRMGGDEFGIVLLGTDVVTASDMAREVGVHLREPFVLEGMPLHVEASIGISLFPGHGRTPSVLLQHADVAMYEAKRGQLPYAVFEPARDGGSRRRLETLEELRTALDSDELVVHYQPKVDLSTGITSGAEALVRWAHPVRGLLYPDSFLPIAEQAGLMRRVAIQVLELALRDLAAWRAMGHDMSVAVNLSVSNLLDAELPLQVSRLLEEHGVPSRALVLEITENILMADAERSTRVLDGLRAIGICLSVDDYGTGYSSLAYLQALPVEELKLDRAFVTHMSSDPRAAAIVRSTIELSHELGMQMVAEGVEDQAAMDMLRDWGCDVAQGFHIARPMAAELLTLWLATSASNRPTPPTELVPLSAGASTP